MNPAQLRARADREERVYAAPDLAKMLRAGADAMEERDRRREALKPFAFFGEEGGDVQHAWGVRYRDRFEDWIDFADIEAARAALAPPAEVYEWNARYDAAWNPEAKE